MLEKIVLVVEDNDDMYLYFDTILKRMGIKNIRAKDGQEAINIFKKQKNDIQLILMDIRLPDMLGYDVTVEILKIEYVFIVTQSACSFNSEKEKSLNCGCVDFIPKPIKIDKLNKVLNKYFFI